MQSKDPSFSISYTLRSGEKEEAPLFILWQLIEKYKVDIFDVSLSRITNDFLAYIEKNSIPLDERSDFAQMAARLIYYKSRLLLPNPGYEEDDDSSEDILPKELIEKLLEYKKYQAASELLADLETERNRSYSRISIWDEYEKEMDFLEVDLLSFLKAFHFFLDRIEKEKVLTIPAENITIEEMMLKLEEKLEIDYEFYFFSWISSFSLIHIVIAFLAILEMARLKKVFLNQEDDYSDIKITRAKNER